jgi:RNA polymerase sigma factor (sigma-70 family)
MAGARTDTELVLAVRSGERDAFGTLFERWFDRVYDVARNIVRSPDTAADVAQDTFIAAWERIDRLDNPDAFGGWLLRIARNRALDRLEREGRSRPQEHDVVTGLHDRGARDLTGSDRTLAPDEISATHDRDELVRAAAVALGEREASILDLHLRHGLTPAEIADELGVTANNAHQLLFRMRKKLGDAIGAFVLFRRGRPACADLSRLLPAGTEFDAATFALVERHRRTCTTCEERRAALLAPEQLFSAAPILVAPLLLRSRVIEHLQAAGVPTPASATGGPLDGPTAGTGREHDVADATVDEWAPPGVDATSSASDRPPTDGEVVPAPVPAPDRWWRRRAIPILGAAAVVILLLAIVARPRDQATADPTTSPATSTDDTPTSPAPTSPAPTSPASIEPRVGAPPATIADALAGASTTAVPAADVAPTTTAPLAPNPPPAAPPPAPTAPPPAPTAPPSTTPPPTTLPPTTLPPTTLPPAPRIIRLFTPVALPPGSLICASGSPHRFDWTSTGATAGTLAIGPTVRSVGAVGPIQACGSSGQVVTLTVTGPGGSTSASTTVP